MFGGGTLGESGFGNRLYGGGGDFGGGGFLPDAADFSQPNQGDGAGRSGRSTNRQSCIPLKAVMLFNAHAGNPADSQLTILGEELQMFKLVGTIVKKDDPTDNSISFMLDDGTAVICVEWPWGLITSDCSSTPHRQQLYDSVQDGAWVAVYGLPHLLGKLTPHVNAQVVRTIRNFNEIPYHDVCVANHIAKSVCGPVPTEHSDAGTARFPQSTSGYMSRPSIPSSSLDPSSATVSEVDGRARGPNWWGTSTTTMGGGDVATGQLRQILAQMTSHSHSGVHVNDLLDQMKKNGFADYTESNLRNGLDSLRREGSAYNTKDQNHWMAIRQ